MFEAIEYIEEELDGIPTGVNLERMLGEFDNERDAVNAARKAREDYGDRHEYAWWVVRRRGERLALWIADSHSDKEFLVDLGTEHIIDLA